MPPHLRDPFKLGAVVNYDGQYRAEIFARGLGNLAHIQGPRRGDDEKREFKDLIAIRDDNGECWQVIIILFHCPNVF